MTVTVGGSKQASRTRGGGTALSSANAAHDCASEVVRNEALLPHSTFTHRYEPYRCAVRCATAVLSLWAVSYGPTRSSASRCAPFSLIMTPPPLASSSGVQDVKNEHGSPSNTSATKRALATMVHHVKKHVGVGKPSLPDVNLTRVNRLRV